MGESNWAARSYSKVVADFLRLLRFTHPNERSGIECAILVIPEKAAVIVIRTALGDRGHRARLTELSAVAHAVYAELRDGLCGRPGVRKRIVVSHVLCANAVHGGL